LTQFKDGQVLPFTVEITDPSGNSFIQNPDAPKVDPHLNVKRYDRSLEDYSTMGYNVDQAADEMKREAEERAKLSKDVDAELKE
jgi:zinc finger protein